MSNEEEFEFYIAADDEQAKPILTLAIALMKRLSTLEEKVEELKDLVILSKYRGINRPNRREHPKVMLFFEEKLTNRYDPNVLPPLNAEVTFRYMKKTHDKFSEADALNLAKEIKSKFAKPIFYWKKGKNMFSYTDWEKGYQFQLEANDEAEARKVVEQTLDLQKHAPDWEYFNIVRNGNPSKAFPDTRHTKTVMGEKVETPRRRPMATVHFKYACIWVAPKRKPTYLVHVQNKHDPLVKL